MPAKKAAVAEAIPTIDQSPEGDPKGELIVAYKGFNQDFCCTPDGKVFQFEVGKTYMIDGPVIACESGFHACEHPLNVFAYYPPATSRFAVVELGGKTQRKGDDTKIAAAEITIKAELRLPELIAAAIKYVTDRVKWIDGTTATADGEGVKSRKDRGAATASGDCGAATASGYQGAATASGYQGVATASGDCGAATASGDWGAATASGQQGAATASGYQGAATASGDWGAATASGDCGAATASGYQGAATASGDWGAATASGMRGAATASGMRGAATASGIGGAATASGFEGKARGKDGCALFLVERSTSRSTSGTIVNAWAGIVGRDGIKADTFYRLADGKPIEVA
jgi:hypothetical protein